MGAAIFVSLERDISSFHASSVDGKSLSKVLEALDALATELKLAPISAFVSASFAEVSEILGEDAPETFKEQWFIASEGLHTIRLLLENLSSAELKNAEFVKVDLENIERILVNADKESVRFHFSVDH